MSDHSDAVDTARTRALRYLPGPRSAPELAAMEAALIAPYGQAGWTSSWTRARVLIGTAAIALAVTIPDLSLGAMGSPSARINISEPVAGLPATVWTPAAGPTGPVYAPVMAAEEIAPAALTITSRARISAFEQVMPLGFLEAGSERFDLAFAGVELPSPVAPELPIRRERALAPRPVRQPLVAPRVVDAIAAPRAALVEVPQLTVSRGFRAAPVPGLRAATPALAPSDLSDRTVAASNESIEAAFAGVIDASSAVRSSLPVTPQRQPAAPAVPVREPVARAVPIPAPAPAVSATAAREAQVVAKTRLDARVNGVLTGAVDFRQLDGTIAIRLGSVLDILRDRFSAREFAQLSSGMSSGAYVTLAELQAAGIPITYNPAYDEVQFGIDYNDAPQAGKVQVEQIGAPTVGIDRAGIDQIVPR